MAIPGEPKREHPGTYFVQDRSSKEEIQRLRILDQIFTARMGGVFAEQSDPSRFRRVLDVGCGPGGWALEAARVYPTLSVFGIDISKTMIEDARNQAAEQGVADRVKFQAMDALRMLEFPPGFFDLVNMRMGTSFMRKWDWPKMLSELQRIAHPGGVVRVTDADIIHASNSPALIRFYEMFQCALFKAGHLFEQETTGITAHLVPLFTQHGLQQVQTKTHELEYQAGTPQGQAYAEGVKNMFHTLRPFIQKWGCISQDYDTIYQQALDEMQRSDFHVTWKLLTVWGEKPAY